MDHNQIFFFHFKEGNGLTIITRGMNQIWLEVKAKSIKKFKSFFVLATSMNVFSKCGEFKLFRFKIWQLWPFFPQKQPSYPSYWIFLVATMQKNSLEKNIDHNQA
jgi:hypothetical protein